MGLVQPLIKLNSTSRISINTSVMKMRRLRYQSQSLKETTKNFNTQKTHLPKTASKCSIQIPTIIQETKMVGDNIFHW